MYRKLSRFLAMLLAVITLVSVTAFASSDDAKFVLPGTIDKMASLLPESEQLPIVKTKTKDGLIYFSISEPVDQVVAQWMGYGEEYEVLELDEENKAIIDLDGHKYQLGARWNNTSYRKYYINYGTDEETEIDVFGTLHDVFVEGDVWYLTDSWHYDETLEDWVTYIYPGSSRDILVGLDTIVQLDEMYDVVDFDDGSYLEITYYEDADGNVLALNGYMYNANDELVGENKQYTPLINSQNVTKISYGKESNGAPNRAYAVTYGDWDIIYTRAGKMIEYTKNEYDTDYFGTGIEGNYGRVTWKTRKAYKVGYIYYIDTVEEKYAEGDIAEIKAEFDQRGKLRHYYVTYRTGENETYTITYDNHDNMQYGTYRGVDAMGTVMHAYTASKTHWADAISGKMTDSVLLNWNLKKYNDPLFQNPPRATE